MGTGDFGVLYCSSRALCTSGAKGNITAEYKSLVLQAVESGVWERPPTALPDANTWPTWGALRERVLTSTTEINILGTATVRDAFVAEVAKLSPPELSKLVSMGHTVHCCPHVLDYCVKT